MTAVQAFEDHITMAKATSIYIHICSSYINRQITLRPELEFKGERAISGKVEKVVLNTRQTEVKKNKSKFPEFKREGQTQQI